MTASPARESVLERAHWPAEEGASLVDLTVGELLARRAEQHAERLAIVGVRHGDGADVRLTYAQLYDEAARVATALSALAVRGSYVALWAPNVVEWPIIQYGAALAGMVLVALNPALREEELEYALTHSGAAVLIYADVSRDYQLASVIEALSPRLPHLRCISLSDRTHWQAAEASPAVLRAAPTDPDEAVDAAVHLRNDGPAQGRAAQTSVVGQRGEADVGGSGGRRPARYVSTRCRCFTPRAA